MGVQTLMSATLECRNIEVGDVEVIQFTFKKHTPYGELVARMVVDIADAERNGQFATNVQALRTLHRTLAEEELEIILSTLASDSLAGLGDGTSPVLELV